MSEKIIAYKGMDENMTCRGKQYEIGKTYTEERAKCCNAGMHACENPLDVFRYYRPDGKTRFFEVECGGEIDREDGKDSKLACTELKVKGELKLADFIRLSVKTTSGGSSSAVATGYKTKAAAIGKNSIAVVNGAFGKACGALGCYLVLTEYDDDDHMLWAKMAKVDGARIKENVWYTLKNGEFVEAEP